MIKETIQRFLSATPDYWRKWQVRGAYLMGLRASLGLIQGVPIYILNDATWVGIIGAVIVLLAQCTCV